jgi:hypothetical protein
MEEPSVLDYVRSKLNPRKWGKIEFPQAEQAGPLNDIAAETQPSSLSEPLEAVERPQSRFPWRVVGAMVFALIAQNMLEPPGRNSTTGIFFYSIAASLILWSMLSKELILPEVKADNPVPMSLQVRKGLMWILLPMALLSFFSFGGNRFTPINLTIWLILLVYVFLAFWIPDPEGHQLGTIQRFRSFLHNPVIHIQIKPFHLLVLGVFVLAVFFRFYLLDKVPGEMFSDHAEKLLDVSDVLSGKTSIFFPRNTGREAFQMYLTAAVSILFGTGLSFISLKIGTAICGVLTLPYIYLLGKEVGNRWVGLFAMLLAGVAYWPNVIARVALRFTLYPLFVAPVLYYLIRGLRRSSRNDLLLSGLFLGIGLHGYSPMRIVPLVVVFAIGLYLLHAQSRGKRVQTILALVLLGLVAIMVFLPLMRYITEDPQMFALRAFSRLGETERTFPAPVWQIFLSNLWKASIMPFWDNGNIWVHSIPGRPAMDLVTAALYFIGVLVLLVRYLRSRSWSDLFLLLAVPLLMMPSILSLAFPDENPSLNRTGGAYVPAFIIAAFGIEAVLRTLYQKARLVSGKTLVVGVGLLLVWITCLNNYNLVFNQYSDQFLRGAWNTSQMGHVIRAFADSVGTPDTAYVVPFPYWVDTRLVAINAGYPTKDYALWPEKFNDTLVEPGAKLFLVKAEDKKDADTLKQMYPNGSLWLQKGPYDGKDFLIFFVPAKVP